MLKQESDCHIFRNIRESDLIKTELSTLPEFSWTWPEELGAGTIKRVTVRPGLSLGFGAFRVFENLELRLDSVSMPVVFHFFPLSCRAYTLNGLDSQTNNLLSGRGFGSIVYQPEWTGSFQFHRDSFFQSVAVYVDPLLLSSFMGEQYDLFPEKLVNIVTGNRGACFFQTFPLPSDIHFLIDQVLNCPYTGVLKRVYLEAKAMEFIACAMSRLAVEKQMDFSEASLSSDDIQRVYAVRHFLLNHLDNPPSLIELARRSGANKNKLSHDFRKVFGTSIFEFIRISRLEHPKSLLEAKEMNVTQAAFEVGYAHQPSFTRAFRQYFGTHPEDMLR